MKYKRAVIHVIQEVIGSFIALGVFFLVGIWILKSGHCIDLIYSKNYTRNLWKIPTIIWYNDIFSSASNHSWNRHKHKINCFNGSRFFGCDVFRPGTPLDDPDAILFYVPYLDKLPLPRNPTTIWGVFHNESPISKLMFMYEEALNLFNFSATISRYSDVPLPLTYLRGLDSVTSTRYFIKTSMKKYFLTDLAPVIYIQSDCDTSTERDAFVKELMKYIQIDSYGFCLHNKDLPLERVYRYFTNKPFLAYLYDDKMMSFIAKYKFIVAIENGVCNDYISEKLWRAIEVGVVPIYYGSPLIRDWLPNNKSAVLLEDFPTPELLSQHLHYLLQNDTAYEEYLEHKIEKRVSNKKLIEELVARPYQTDFVNITNKFECFICEKLHNKESNGVNIVTKKHYDCPLPTSALTLSVNPENPWVRYVDEAKENKDELYEDIRSPNQTKRETAASCSDQYVLRTVLAGLGWMNFV